MSSNDIVVEKEYDGNGFVIGGNGLSIAWDSAISEGDWTEIKDDVIAINILTLIRNAISAFDKTYTMHDLMGSNVGVIIEADVSIVKERVEDDIRILTEFFSDVHNSKIHIYSIDYDVLPLAGLPHYKTAKTDKQKIVASFTKRLMNLLKESIDRKYGDRLNFTCGYVVSHILFDLVDTPHSTRLIETHTGAIKSKEEMNSKLNLTAEEKLVVPFTRLTYLLYGDKQLLNKSPVVKSTNLLELLIKANVTPFTTETRLSMAIKNNAPMLFNLYKKVLQ